MHCAACGETTTGARCEGCGAAPLLEGRYRLDEVIAGSDPRTATTGAAVVYRGVRISDDLPVVAKMVAYRSISSFQPVEDLEREAATLGGLDHSGIPKLLEMLETGEGKQQSVWQVRTFMPGEDLERRTAPVRDDEVMRVVREAADILAYLHERRPALIHRDITPRHLILRPDGSVGLISFASAGEVGADDAGSLDGATVGAYAAPERALGEDQPAGDVYALGLTALRLLTGRDAERLRDADGAVPESVWATLSDRWQALRPLVAANPATRLRDGRAVLLHLDGAPALVPVTALPSLPPVADDASEGTDAVGMSSQGWIMLASLGAVFSMLFGWPAAMLVLAGGLVGSLSMELRGPTPPRPPRPWPRNVPGAVALFGLALLWLPLAFALFGPVWFAFFGPGPTLISLAVARALFHGIPMSGRLEDGDKPRLGDGRS